MVIMRRGGGAKRLARNVDSSQISHLGEKAKVLGFEYDPNRSAFITLIKYESGEQSYILAADKMKKGKEIICDEKTLAQIGNRMKIKNIPASTQVYNIELVSGHGGQICRSAGSYATLLGVDGKFAQLRMPSGEIRRVLTENYASIGVVSNSEHSKIKIGKAGRSRLMGKRPTVRGKAKNPCDHPHGGGEGGAGIGMKYPKTPWGMPALGRRTRNKKKVSSKQIISRRKK